MAREGQHRAASGGGAAAVLTAVAFLTASSPPLAQTLAPHAAAGDDPFASASASPPSTTTAPESVTVLTSEEIREALEVRDPLPIARGIDLTAAPDDLWDRIRNGFGMPNLASALVLDRQIWYASRPGTIKRIVGRSRRYLYHIVEELERRGMPMEIALLPMVESAFNPMAYSRAHASGLWQFIPSTGKNYNLRQNWWLDERRDILASTSAALDYLEFLYDMHGDWHLALASYNWGENAVARAIERNRAKGLPTDYLSLGMPAETRYYVPKLQALKNIVSNPAAFGVDLEPIPNQRYFVTVAKTQDIDIKVAAKLADMTVEELIALNPAHNRPVISAMGTLVLPEDRVETFQANLSRHNKPLSSWQTYTLKPGEKLERVAARHGITLARLKQVNGIGARGKGVPAQQILVPVKGSSAAREPPPALFQPPAQVQTAARKIVYTVKKGDTLMAIARRHQVSAEDLRRWNGDGRLKAGQQIVIHQRAVARPVAASGASLKRPGAAASAKRSQPAR